MDFKTIVQFLFGAAVRHMLTVFGVWLTTLGATADQANAIVSNGFDLIIGLLVIGLSLGWAYLSKYLAFTATPPGK